MDIRISLINFDITGLELTMEEEPARVFIDFKEIAEITQREFSKVIKIYDRFKEQSLLFVNLTDYAKKQLRFLFKRDDKIRVLDETKRN